MISINHFLKLRQGALHSLSPTHLAKICLSKVFANVCHIYLGMSAPTKYMLHGRSLLNIRACFHTASCLVWI